MNHPYPPRTKENTVECKVINMTPELASHYLSNNPSNRPISKSRVEAFAGMMESGQWALNGETIVISSTGRLLDGQHRLAAVVRYDGPVQMLVATGAPDAAFSTIDIGAKRSIGQICGMNGVPNAHLTSAAAAILFRLFHGLAPTGAVPAPYILEIIKRYPEFDAWSPKARACRSVISAAILLAACVYLDAIALRPDLADEIVDGLKTGENLARGNPVLALRNRALSARGNAGGGHGRAIWVALVRTIDAMEAATPLTVIKSGASSWVTLRPARFVANTQSFTPKQRLQDLVPAGAAVVDRELIFAAQQAA
jgi:hypothetical protein